MGGRLSGDAAWEVLDDRSADCQMVPTARFAEIVLPLAKPQKTLKHVRFVVLQTRNPSENCLQLATFDILDSSNERVEARNATNPGGRSPGSEGVSNVIDGNPKTKWLDWN